MRAWHIVRSRLRSLVFRGSRESDLSEELQLHLERETERLQASGLSREDARLQALRLFGGVEQIKEASRDARGTAALDALARDTRHGLRRLVRDWRFTTAAVLILGLAIGANTAIFSVVNAVLFRDQAFADPDRLVDIYQNDPAGKPLVVISYDAYKEMAEYTDIFAATMAASIPIPARYLHEGGIRSGTAEFATATYLDVLGLRPSLGRWFDATEERPGAPLVAVLGHQAWTRVFRADPSVVGRVVRIEGVPVTIVGIGPANHRGTVDVGLVTDFWLPITALRELNPMPGAARRPHDIRTLVRESPSARGRHRGAGQSGDGRARTPARGRVSGCVSRARASSPWAQASRSFPRRTCGSTRRRTCRSWRSPRWCSSSSASSSPSRAATWPRCCWCAAPRVRKKSRCGWPWAPSGLSSCGTC